MSELIAHPDWWSGWLGALIGGVIGAVLGSSIPLSWSARQRRRERTGEIWAMQVELRLAKLHMDTLLEEGLHGMPLYQIPLSMFHRALPKLIGEKKLTLNQISLLVEYVNRAEELNRGLDHAVRASVDLKSIVPAIERSSNRERARAILQEKLVRHGDQTLYDGAWYALIDADESWIIRLWRWICDRWEFGAFG